MDALHFKGRWLISRDSADPLGGFVVIRPDWLV
jgi:hypothetical protein